MELEVELLVSVSDGYLYRHRAGEMGENAKRENGDHRMQRIWESLFYLMTTLKRIDFYIIGYYHRMQSILLLKCIKLGFIIFFKSKVAGKH